MIRKGFVVASALTLALAANLQASGTVNLLPSRVEAALPASRSFTGPSATDFVNTLGSSVTPVQIPRNFENAGEMLYHAATMQKICEYAGYTTVVASSAGHWSSCGDNHLAYWNGSQFVWTYRNACALGNIKINSLVCGTPVQCNDGVDNDGDGAADYPGDFSCSSSSDNDETNPKAQCGDGADNDNDGATDYPADFSCSSKQDNDETNPKAACQDGADNDNDGLTDYPADLGCTSKQDNDESGGTPVGQCNDNIDNDNDGLKDFPADTGCTSATDTDEANPTVNLKINGQDGTVTVQAGASITLSWNSTDTGRCNTGTSNMPGWGPNVPLPLDGSVTLTASQTGTYGIHCAETATSNMVAQDSVAVVIGGTPNTQCNDGIDNDNDGATDLADFSCSSATDNDETNPKAACQDGIDNDNDGLTDYPADAGCTSSQDNDETGGSNQCIIVRATTYQPGPSYATLPSPLPSHVTLRDINLYNHTLTSADLQGAKLVIYGDSHIGSGPYRTLSNTELSLFQQAYNTGTNFTFAADNPQGDEASFGTRQIMNYIQGNMRYSEIFAGTQSGVHSPNTTAFPFLSGKLFDFSNSGLDSPGDIVNIVSPAQCAFSLNNRCHAAWLPAANGKGFVFVEGNAGVGSQNYLQNFINTACPPPVQTPQCSDGIDNDNDGAIDTADFSCSSSSDNDETNPKAACQDGIDNDGDGLTDYPMDLGCNSRQDNDETGGSSQICSQASFNATGGSLTSQGWTALDPGTSQSAVTMTENGVTFLRITDNSTARGLRTEYPAILDSALADRDWTLEMKARILASNSGPYPALTGMNMLLTSPGGKYVSIYIDTSKFGPIGPSLTQYEYGRTVNRNTTDGFHVYTISHHKNGAGVNDDTFDILFDGQVVIPTITRSEIWNSAVHGQNINGLSFGIGSSPGTGVMDVAYVNFRNTESSCPAQNQCSDGIDNDNDGAIDLADFSCSNGGDNDETNPKAACQDGIDNDNDGLTDYPSDPGCTSKQDNDEVNGGSSNPQCSDFIDNDGDGLIDIADPGCHHDFNRFNANSYNPNGTSEASNQNKGTCADGIDNNNNFLIDAFDPICHTDGNTSNPSSFDPSRNETGTGGNTQCSDGIDNDNDGATDYPADFSCSSSTDTDEANPKAQCQDGFDNDGDGLTDHPADPGCTSKQDNDETGGSGTTQCNDGIDNDNDGATDLADFSCSSSSDTDETNPKSQCQDGIDNDGDGLTDHPADPGCTSKQDNDEGTSNSGSADLAVTLTGPSSITQGSTAIYTATVTNNGPSTATNVRVTDPPAGFVFLPGQSSSGCAQSGTSVVCTLASLNAGSSQSFTLAFSTTSSSCNISVTDIATVTSNNPDPNSANNQSQSVVTFVNCSGGGTNQCADGIDNDSDGVIDYADPDCHTDGNAQNGSSYDPSRTENSTNSGNDSCLDISIEDDRDPAEPGDTVEYEITVENDCATSRTFTLRALLDNDMEFEDASGNGDDINDDEVQWQNITIPAGDDRDFTLEVELDDDLDDGDEVELEVYIGSQHERETTDIEDDTGGKSTGGTGGSTGGYNGSLLSVTKSADRSTAQPGDTVVYTLSIRNNGNQAATNITVEDQFNSGQLSILDPAGGAVNGSTLRWQFDRIDANTTRTLRYTARISGSMRHGDTVQNNVRVNGSNVSANDSNLIRIIQQLPQTGIGNMRLGDGGTTSPLLTKAYDASEPSAVADIVAMISWLATITTGVGAGAMVGRRLLI